MTVAETTIKQMGGTNRLSTMIGAKHFVQDGDSVQFKFAMCPKANFVKISLNSLDLYDIEFVKIGRMNLRTGSQKITTTGEINGVYGDQLKEVFERFTGLYLSL